jgi:hypothetical protein
MKMSFLKWCLLSFLNYLNTLFIFQ